MEIVDNASIFSISRMDMKFVSWETKHLESYPKLTQQPTISSTRLVEGNICRNSSF